MERQIIEVSQLNAYVKALVEQDEGLAALCVRGEISNYKIYPSGHHYFTLKDETSTLRCVMFKSSAQSLRFHPENGMKILTFGRLSVFPRDGTYQLYCSRMIIDGVGDLHAAFEQTKARLAAQGLFAPEHKKPLPAYPGTIAIITSAAGAAVHDMLRILRKRFPLSRVRILGVRVQGAEAPAELSAALRYVNRWKLADLILIGRGGGSLEDLWAFNDERLAYEIYRSEIPVISAVGHEPDVTISDYVADLRAATPSNAAELAVPDQNALRRQMSSAQSAIAGQLVRQIKLNRQRLRVLAASRPMQSPIAYLDERRLLLDRMQQRLCAAQQQNLQRMQQRYSRFAASLDAMSPLKVLSRGYAFAQMEDGTLLRSARQLRHGDIFSLQLSDGRIHAQAVDTGQGSFSTVDGEGAIHDRKE